MLSRCCKRCEAATIRDDGDVRYDQHGERFFHNWVWKRVKIGVDAGIAWRAWSGKTCYARRLGVTSSRDVRKQGNVLRALMI